MTCSTEYGAKIIVHDEQVRIWRELVVALLKALSSIFLYNGYRVFPGGKVRPSRDADPSPPYIAEVKNRVELYLYSP